MYIHETYVVFQTYFELNNLFLCSIWKTNLILSISPLQMITSLNDISNLYNTNNDFNAILDNYLHFNIIIRLINF
jgi:hypothetical protein